VRVTLANELFEPPVQDATLISFFNYALEDRHRIEADLDHPIVANWLMAQSGGVQQDVRLAVDSSAELEAREPAVTRAVVGRFPNNDFATNPIRLRLQTAATFLERPLSLLLEDANADRAFLMAMLTPEERRALERQVARGYVQVEHGGGLGTMRTRVTERSAEPSTRHRLWVLFDSDSLRPNQPSRQSEALRTACRDVPHYQLVRRQIESYIPGPALNAWAYVGTGRTARRRRGPIVDAFCRLTDARRHHFNMKAGFAGDAARQDASAGDLYDGVAEADKITLSGGFGPQIGDLFQTDHVKEQDLRRDSGWSELRPAIERLISLTR
jgi:hypothetical protein